MVKLLEIESLNQVLVTGKYASVLMYIDMLDINYIESVYITYRGTSEGEYQATAICKMTKTWKKRRGSNLRHLKLVI